MKRIILFAVGALLACSVHAADTVEAPRGIANTFNFVLYNTDGTLDTDEVDGGTEVSVSCDEGAETTATNDFVDEGTFYSIALTAAEMECDRVAVVVAATDTNVFFIRTDGQSKGIVAQGTAQTYTAGTPSLTLDSSETFADDDLNNSLIQICDVSVGYCQTATITDYANTGDIATLDAALNTAVAGADISYTIWGLPQSGGTVANIETDTQDIQSRIPAALVGGRIDSTVDGTGMEAAAAAVVVDAWETQSQADPTGFHVNIKEINGVTITGDGSGTPFDVASFRDFRRACEFYGSGCAEYTRAAFRQLQEQAEALELNPTLLEIVASL